MTKLTVQTLSEFTECLSSRAPVPGGGGAAALIGALASSLGVMATTLTLGKKKYLDYEQDHQRIIDRLNSLHRPDEGFFHAPGICVDTMPGKLNDRICSFSFSTVTQSAAFSLRHSTKRFTADCCAARILPFSSEKTLLAPQAAPLYNHLLEKKLILPTAAERRAFYEDHYIRARRCNLPGK